MASIDPSLISDPKEQKWVDEISKILNPQLHINIKTPNISVFQVPEIISTTKPEAYEPQQIGLGPHHHFRPQPYKKMEQKKLAVVRKVLDHHKIEDFELTVLDKVRKIVPMVRDCYDMFLQDDDDSLAWILAIDGMFLLGLFHSYNDGMLDEEEELELRRKKESEAQMILMEALKKFNDSSVPMETRIEDWDIASEKHDHAMEEASKPQKPLIEINQKKRLLAQDLLMAENQIPYVVLKEIDEALHPSSGKKLSPWLFQTFTKIHSPLELCSASVIAPEHLLDYMYHSIVGTPQDNSKPELPLLKSGSSKFENTLNFVKSIPKDEIAQLYKQTVSALETFSNAKIPFPSASKLHDTAGYEFYNMPSIRDVNIIIINKGIYLPCVTLNVDSEVTLRNLVAYETSLIDSDSFPLSEYLGFMCALIVDVEDVKLLQKKDIIKGDLGVDEVTKLFTGMNSSIPTMKTKVKSNLQVKIDEVRKDYERRWTMKIYILLKRFARWLLKGIQAVGGFVESSWKIVAVVVSILTVFMLTWQAYCNTFGCDKTKVTTILAYASA